LFFSDEPQITDSELQAYADGRLGEERSRAVEAWLAARPDDAERIAAYRRLGEELRRAYDPVVLWCRASRVPEPELEFVFAWPRKWRFDYAFVPAKLALEIEGGAFIVGRHTRGRGFSNDLVKYAEAAILGWTVLRATPEQITNGTAFGWLTRWFQGRV